LGSFTCRKARHGTDGFTSPPKEGVLRIFSPEKSGGFEPANLGTKGQHATSRPPKPQAWDELVFLILPIIGIIGDKDMYLAYYVHLPGIKKINFLLQNIIFKKA
jgi:hypothetical protein